VVYSNHKGATGLFDHPTENIVSILLERDEAVIHQFLDLAFGETKFAHFLSNFCVCRGSQMQVLLERELTLALTPPSWNSVQSIFFSAVATAEIYSGCLVWKILLKSLHKIFVRAVAVLPHSIGQKKSCLDYSGGIILVNLVR